MRGPSVGLAAVCLAAALSLTACDNGEPRAAGLGLTHTPADLAELEGGVWVANDVQDPDVSLVPGSQVELRFRQDSLSATAGCNNLFGGASIEGDELVVPALASTKKACDDSLSRQDAWLSDFLSSRPSIEVLEQELWISHGDDTVLHLVQE